MGCNSSKVDGDCKAETPPIPYEAEERPDHIHIDEAKPTKTTDLEVKNELTTVEVVPDAVSQTIEDVSLNRYVFVKKIGSGSQGEVRIAKNESGVLFAVKIIPKKKTLFRNKKASSALDTLDKAVSKEIEVMKGLDHPNIVRLFEVVASESQKKIFLVMEYVDGGPVMSDRLVGQRPFSEQRSLDLFRQLLKGLEYLHFHGIVHRDIKPSNLLVTKSGLLKISDFGISFICKPQDVSVSSSPNDVYKSAFHEAIEKKSNVRFVVAENEDHEKVLFSNTSDVQKIKSEEHQRLLGKLYPPTPYVVTQRNSSNEDNDALGLISGTYAFVPPEAFNEDKSLYTGKVADLWAAGISLYMFLFGMVPFIGETNNEIIKKITHDDLAFPKSVLVSYDASGKDLENPKQIAVNLSSECLIFLGKLLDKDQTSRMTTIGDVKANAWVKTGWKRSISAPLHDR